MIRYCYDTVSRFGVIPSAHASMPSVRDIAKKTGVSAATVSRALKSHPGISADTRRRVLRAANQAGYVATAGPRADVCIGYVTAAGAPLSLYDCLLINGIREGLELAKLDLQLVNVQRDKTPEETYTDFFTRRGLRGVVMQAYTAYREVCEQVAAEGFASVMIADDFDSPRVSFVCCDSTQQSQRAVEHLIHLGHERIALALPRHEDHDHSNRRDGYARALEANGVPLRDELIVQTQPTREGGEHAFNELLSRREPPTAIYFTDPFPAVGALCRAHAVGVSVPEQLSIVGFDDGNMRRQVHPLLTAVCQPTEELGLEAGRWLGRRVRGEALPPLRRVLQPTLEINQTTAVPPARPVRIQPGGAPMREPG